MLPIKLRSLVALFAALPLASLACGSTVSTPAGGGEGGSGEGGSNPTSTWCSYLGFSYSWHDIFPSADGCNSCTCTEDGGFSCGEDLCSCDPQSEWWRSYVALSPDECAVIDYDCGWPLGSFHNECGCGCEQNPECPEVIHCGPDLACEATIDLCPLSAVEAPT